MEKNKPFLSIVICVYNMRREAPRTIVSALPPYQKNADESMYEVIVVDNGSQDPIDEQFLNSLPDMVKYVHYPGKTISPVFALNWAVAQIAKGSHIMFCIDGARMFSQNLVSSSFRCASLHQKAFVYSLGWHLGPDFQNQSCKEGYNQQVEDSLLEGIDWYHHPEKLFSISVFARSSSPGFFSAISESTAFTVSRKLLAEFGGFDERFTSSGGGLANLEMFARYVCNEQVLNICLLGEGTFHQFHGGVATSGKSTWKDFNKEYIAIFGKPYQLPQYQAMYDGAFTKEVYPFYLESLEKLKSLQS